jgi:hypothetical protein
LWNVAVRSISPPNAMTAVLTEFLNVLEVERAHYEMEQISARQAVVFQAAVGSAMTYCRRSASPSGDCGDVPPDCRTNGSRRASATLFG